MADSSAGMRAKSHQHHQERALTFLFLSQRISRTMYISPYPPAVELVLPPAFPLYARRRTQRARSRSAFVSAAKLLAARRCRSSSST